MVVVSKAEMSVSWHMVVVSELEMKVSWHMVVISEPEMSVSDAETGVWGRLVIVSESENGFTGIFQLWWLRLDVFFACVCLGKLGMVDCFDGERVWLIDDLTVDGLPKAGH